MKDPKRTDRADVHEIVTGAQACLAITEWLNRNGRMPNGEYEQTRITTHADGSVEVESWRAK